MAKPQSTDESKNLPAVPGGNFLAIAQADSIGAVMKENLEGVDLGSFDLPTIKVPTGDVTFFQIASASGSKAVQDFEAIILHHHKCRRYYEKGVDDADDQGLPPDCKSDDGITGTPNPESQAANKGQGGDCKNCPMAQYGTASKGDGQACSERRRLFLLLPDATLPMRLELPPTSLINWKEFTVRMTNAGIGVKSAVVKVGLEQSISKSSKKKCVRATFTLVDQLHDEQKQLVAGYRDAIMGNIN